MADTETQLPQDPTAFRPMRQPASRDTPVGFELEPVTKTFTLDKSRIYQGWPAARNRHTDFDAAHATGAPVITVLLSGRPLILGAALENSEALIAAWLPGTEGQGVADVLFGDFKPTSRLPQPWPRNNAALSNAKIKPLFPLGFGLE